MDNENHIADLLGKAIESTGMAEVIRVTDGSQVSAFFRVLNEKMWSKVLEYILVRKTCWDAHICKHYFMRGTKLVYGWNFTLQPKDDPLQVMAEVHRLLQEGARVAPKVSAVRGPLSSFPLVGASPRRTASNAVFDPRLPGPGRGGPSHRGAFSVRTEE